jgi:glycosyltransferase involved in cell wall biosynthesis
MPSQQPARTTPSGDAHLGGTYLGDAPLNDARRATRHVCFVAPFGLGQKTTIWARTLPLARQLVARGWRATILLPPWDTPDDAGRTWQDGGVDLVNVTLAGGIPGTTRRLLRELDARTPDIVHIVKPRAHAGLVQWVLAQGPLVRRTLAPAGAATAPGVVLDIDDWEQAWGPINRYSWPLARFLAWQEEWGIRQAPAITAASRWLERRAHTYAPQTPVLYLPNGVDTAAPPPGWQPPADGAVLFFTRFVEVAPAWLAEFAAALYTLRPQLRLVVGGTPVQPGLDAPFREAVAATPAAGAVEWLGFVPRDELPALYARTSCAIFPAADVPLQQAKCSVRLASTLLQGVPVVASAVGEQAAYGADGAARLVPPNASPAEFAAAVDQVLRQPAAQLALAATARARLLQRYDWATLAQRLLDFYARLPGG